MSKLIDGTPLHSMGSILNDIQESVKQNMSKLIDGTPLHSMGSILNDIQESVEAEHEQTHRWNPSALYGEHIE